jgi:hypothetical protein
MNEGKKQAGDEVLKRLLETPPKPHKPKKGNRKKKPTK